MTADTEVRDRRTNPRVGDTFRFGRLWVRVESDTPRTVLRLIQPGMHEATAEFVLPLPRAMAPIAWTRQDLMRAASRVLPRRGGRR